VASCGLKSAHGIGMGGGTPIGGGLAGMPMTLPIAQIFTIFEGTSEIQRMLIGRAVTGLDVR